MNNEQKVDHISDYLIGDWYAAEDWGEDKFTDAMCADYSRSENELKLKIFEATCYYVAQQLIYNEAFLKELERIKDA